MIGIKASITGDKEIDRLLRDLGQKSLKDSVIKQGLRKLAKPVIKSMKTNAKAKDKHKATKKLAKSIGIIRNVKSKKGRPFILVGPRYYTQEGVYYFNMVEYGKEKYDVEFEGKKYVRNTFEEHKTKLIIDLRKLIIELLTKKLKKFR